MRHLLLLHGIGCTGAVFDRMIPALANHGITASAPTLFPDLRTVSAPPPELLNLCFQDYVTAAAAEVAKVRAITGSEPWLLGHSMGGLIVQKLASQGIGAAGVLLTPAQPADCQGFALGPLYTFWNVIKAGDIGRAYKVWEKGFSWGVLNRVPKSRHAEIYSGAVHDPGILYRDLGQPAKDPNRTAFIDATSINIPLLTIAAKHDRATPAAAVRRVGRKYAAVGGSFIEYADAGHWLVDEPGTDRMVADVAHWLQALEATAGPAPSA